jgi:hypothetical protein
MKVIVSQIITVLISLSAIIAPLIPVYDAEWVEAHDGPREFISTTKRDRIREQGEMETFGITNTHGIRRMTIINNTPESAIELTNKWKNQQTYRVYDKARGVNPWLQKTIGPRETHVFTVVGREFEVFIVGRRL